jgi:hypothetical protein
MDLYALGTFNQAADGEELNPQPIWLPPLSERFCA